MSRGQYLLFILVISFSLNSFARQGALVKVQLEAISQTESTIDTEHCYTDFKSSVDLCYSNSPQGWPYSSLERCVDVAIEKFENCYEMITASSK